MLVSEQIIDSIVEDAKSGKIHAEDFFESFPLVQGPLWIYLQEEILPILTPEEAEYLLFMLFIIYKSIERAKTEIKEISLDDFQQAEEANWEKFDTNKSKIFKAKLDNFFINYTEEDLLAFIEDMLTLDEEDEITSIGREPVFVICKSLVDVCIKN